jgi:hypothetical protein
LPSSSTRAFWTARSRDDVVLGQLLAGHDGRARRRDVQRDVLHEILEPVRLGDEVGLAVDLEQDADLAAGVDVAVHHAFGRRAAGLLGGLRDALGAEPVDRLLGVPAVLGEGLLAVEDAGAGTLAQVLDDLHGHDSLHDAPSETGRRMFGDAVRTNQAFASSLSSDST